MNFPRWPGIAAESKHLSILGFVLFVSLLPAHASSVVAWGYNGSGQTNVPTGLTNGVTVAAGSSHCLALKSDGKITGWGYNGYAQAVAPASLSNMVAIAGGGEHTIALRKDGSVAAWGYNYYGEAA